MRKYLLIVGLLVAIAPAAGQSVVGTLHDLSADGGTSEVCVYCHTPHQAAAATVQQPLWNHTVSTTANFGVYASNTLNATDLADIGGQAVGSQSVSALCMGCHDGSVALESLYNPPNSGAPGAIGTITGNANLGTSLVDDHPVNFTYDNTLATADGGLAVPTDGTTVDGTVPLFGGTVQCASCHDPHNDTNTPFLVATNAGSALCLRCHNK